MSTARTGQRSHHPCRIGDRYELFGEVGNHLTLGNAGFTTCPCDVRKRRKVRADSLYTWHVTGVVKVCFDDTVREQRAVRRCLFSGGN